MIIMLLLVAMALYCIGFVGIAWFVCDLCGWPFNVAAAIGAWIVVNLVIAKIQKAVKK